MDILRVGGPEAHFIDEQEFLDYLQDEYFDCKTPLYFEDMFENEVYQFFMVKKGKIIRITAKDISMSFLPCFTLK